METDHHARDHRPRPHCHRGPDRPQLRCACPVFPLAAGGHWHPGLDQVPPATLPPVAWPHGCERLSPVTPCRIVAEATTSLPASSGYKAGRAEHPRLLTFPTVECVQPSRTSEP